MTSEKLPVVSPESTFKEIIHTMTKGKLGLCLVTENMKIKGIVTDGDLRRALERTDQPRFGFIAKDIMTLTPKTIHQDEMAIEAEECMLEHKINELLVVDESENLVGIVQLFDTGIIS